MRTLLTAFALLACPTLAHASVDFKCESPQVVGWLHFGYAGANGSVQLESWAGFPPVSLIDADLDAGTAVAPGAVRFQSQADRTNGARAQVDLPPDYLAADKFSARVILGKAFYALKCVRH